jgi:methionine synthase II (cobalamin-independent)
VIKDKKIVIGVVDHHTLQVERPDEVAALVSVRRLLESFESFGFDGAHLDSRRG